MSVPIYLKKRNVSTFKATPDFKPDIVIMSWFLGIAVSISSAGRHCTLSAF